MTSRVKVFAVVLLAAVAAGCVSRRSGGTVGNTAQWIEGFTQRREVVAAWGNPDRVDGNVWVWRERFYIGGKVKASSFGVGLTVSRLNGAVREHKLTFDECGRLRAIETYLSVVNSPSWSIIPW